MHAIMKLTLEQIRSITLGALDIRQPSLISAILLLIAVLVVLMPVIKKLRAGSKKAKVNA